MKELNYWIKCYNQNTCFSNNKNHHSFPCEYLSQKVSILWLCHALGGAPDLLLLVRGLAPAHKGGWMRENFQP